MKETLGIVALDTDATLSPAVYDDEMRGKDMEYGNEKDMEYGPYVKLLPDYALCNFTNHSHLPLCSNTTETEDEFDKVFQYYHIVAIVVPIIFGIVFLVGVFGNTLVVIVIIVNKQMRSTTNYLLVSLAVADLLFLVFCVPFTAFDYMLDSWPFGTAWCKIVQYLTYMTAYASVYTLLLLSIDRFVAVVHPVISLTVRTERNAFYVIALTWTIITILCLPLYIVHGIFYEVVSEEEYQLCTFMKEYNEKVFRITFLTTSYFIPLLVSLVLYMMILNQLWRGVAPGGHRSAESTRNKKKVTRMVIVVIVTFMVCWFPIQVILLLKSLDAYIMDAPGVIAQISGQVLAYTNSCLNPILYAFFSEPFRKAFHKVILCRSGNRPNKGRASLQKSRDSRATNQNISPSAIPLTTFGDDSERRATIEITSTTPLTSATFINGNV